MYRCSGLEISPSNTIASGSAEFGDLEIVARCRRWGTFLGGGFKYFLFSSLLGEDSHFDYCNIFQMGWNHQPGNIFLGILNSSHPDFFNEKPNPPHCTLGAWTKQLLGKSPNFRIHERTKSNQDAKVGIRIFIWGFPRMLVANNHGFYY